MNVGELTLLWSDIDLKPCMIFVVQEHAKELEIDVEQANPDIRLQDA